jgi:hypothetical protein
MVKILLVFVTNAFYVHGYSLFFLIRLDSNRSECVMFKLSMEQKWNDK